MPFVAPLGWLAALQQLAPQRHAVLISVLHSAGSVPRENGARMLVTERHQYDTIGGGHLEWQALQTARSWLAEPLREQTGEDSNAIDNQRTRTQHLTLGASLGQCCGGVLTLRYDRLDAYSNVDYALFERSLMQHQTPQPRLYLFGAGHVARALVQVLEQTPCDIVWVDEREDLFPAHLPAHITIEVTDTPEAVIAQAPAGSHFLVMTHHHGLDLRLAEQVLRRPSGDNSWFGMIGSRTKRASFTHRLREKNIPAERIQHMVCPIGIPEISGKQPGMIAIAVAAQLWQAWQAWTSSAASAASPDAGASTDQASIPASIPASNSSLQEPHDQPA